MTYSTIFKFWFPLLGTWLLMAVEGPLATAYIARLASPELNLGSYGLAFAVALVIEGPVIMIMGAVTALVKNKQDYLVFRSFVNRLALLVCFTTAIALSPPVFHYLFLDLIGLEPDLTQLTYRSCLIFIPWPLAICYRRFWQGILIRAGKTRLIAVGTTIRLLAVISILSIGSLFPIEGSYLGAFALTSAVVIEGIVSYLLTKPYIERLPEADVNSTENRRLTRSYIFTYFVEIIVN